MAALDFSSDGNLIVAMAGGDGQALSVWDWRRGVRLATARAEICFLPAISVRFNPWLFLEGRGGEAAGLPPGDACYTLVSCGERHVRFWTLTRERYVGGGRRRRERRNAREDVDEEGEMVAESHGDSGGDGGGRGWVWTLTSSAGSFGERGEVDHMTCMTFIGEPWSESEERRRKGMVRDAGDGVTRLPAARVVTGARSGQVGMAGTEGKGKRMSRRYAG